MKIGIAGPISTESVAHLLRDAPPDIKGSAGAPFLGTLITTLHERGHEINAYTLDSSLSPHIDEATVAVGNRFRLYYLPCRRRAFRFSGGTFGRMSDFYRLERRALTRAMMDDPPDLIHAHWTYEFALAAQATGLPCVITAHDSPLQVLRFMPNLFRFGRYLMARTALRSATRLTAVSPYLQEEIRGLTRVPVEVVPNPMPSLPGAAGAFQKKDLRQLKAPKIAMINSGWDRRKNVGPALEGFQLVRQQFPAASLHMFGGDFGPGELAEEWARQHGLVEGVVFHGRTAYENLMNTLSQMDVFCHPALEECCCMTIVEAMSLGVPVVGGEQSGGVPWQVEDGKSGILVNVKSPSSIASGIIELVSDPEKYEELSRRSFSRARELFARETIATSYERVYRNVLNSVGRESPVSTGSHA